MWVSAISSSSYWDLIYPSVTVHSSASATITVAGKTFTSDASGNTQHSMPWGTFSISDSVSGQSFECTIDRDTTEVYAMPEGALYWYGFISDELEINPLSAKEDNRTLGTVTQNSNNLYMNASVSLSICGVMTKDKVQSDIYSVCKAKTIQGSGNNFYGVLKFMENSSIYLISSSDTSYTSKQTKAVQTLSVPIPFDSNIAFYADNGRTSTLVALWLE